MLRKLVLLLGLVWMVQAQARPLETSGGPVVVEKRVDGLNEPWSIGFLPNGALLITERDGTLYHVPPDGQKNRVAGVPKVFARGQGGLFDILIPRDFPTDREVFLSYAVSQPGGAGTAVAAARLSKDGRRLERVREIFATGPSGDTGRHFGGRLVEARDGMIFLTVGDRGDAPKAQLNATHQGAVLRLTPAGKAAPGNPFLGQDGVAPEIWSYGHRNPQGAALDLSGHLWVNEHGARGGDEVNRVRRGANYGWPVISYGRHYNGAKIGEGTHKAGMEQPAHYWDPSIAPSGLMIYSGKLWPAWRGQLFVGSLKFDYISRLGGEVLSELEKISAPETGRVRDVREAPDGTIWFLSVTQGAAYRLRPQP